MDSSIVVAIITGIVTIISVIVSVKTSNKEITHKLETHQAVTDTKLDNLATEVHKHNSFAERVPVMEEKLSSFQRRLEVVERETQRTHSQID